MTAEVEDRISKIQMGMIPSGYKMTRKGIIPVTWAVQPIKNFATVSSGSTPDRKNEDYWNGDIPWVTTGELQSGYIVKTKENVTEQACSKIGLRKYPVGTLLMAMYGQGKTRGTVARLGIEATVNQACAAISIKEGNSEFYFYSLQNAYDDIRKMSNTGNQENLNADIIKSFPLICPTDAEQEKIAQILLLQDTLIELKEAYLQEKLKQKEYLVQQLLTGAKRLTGFCKKWETQSLGELFTERTETKCENLPLLAITGSRGVIPRSELDIKDNSSEDKSKYLRICKGDIGYNTMRMWQGVSAYSEFEGIVSPAYTILKPCDSINAKFFSYLFKLDSVVFMFFRHSQGLVDDTRNLKYDQFRRIKVRYPKDIREQNAIVAVLSNIDREIELLQESIKQEKQKKKAMMQLLLTGIVRL